MTAFVTTRRDLAMIKDLALVPVSWGSVDDGDVVRSGKDGLDWMVVSIDKHFATAMVRLVHGRHEAVVEVGLEDAAHVLQDSTGFRRSQYSGTEPVRLRTPKGK